MAVTDSAIYWTDAHDGSNTIGYVRRVPVAGGRESVLASAKAVYSGIAADPRPMHDARPGGKLRFWPHSTRGSPRGGIAVDQSNVYWGAAFNDGGAGCVVPAQMGKIMRVPRTGGMPVILATERSAPSNIALDSANVYWVSDTGLKVMKVSKVPACILVDTTSVYWLNVSGPRDQIHASNSEVTRSGPMK